MVFPRYSGFATSRTDIHDIAEILLENSISQRIFYKGQPNVSYNVTLPITDIFLDFLGWHLYTGLTVYSERKQIQQHIQLYIKEGGLG